MQEYQRTERFTYTHESIHLWPDLGRKKVYQEPIKCECMRENKFWIFVLLKISKDDNKLRIAQRKRFLWCKEVWIYAENMCKKTFRCWFWQTFSSFLLGNALKSLCSEFQYFSILRCSHFIFLPPTQHRDFNAHKISINDLEHNTCAPTTLVCTAVARLC